VKTQDETPQVFLRRGSESTLTYLGRGNVYIGGAFAHSKRASIDIQKATWNTTVMAAQNGTDIVIGSNKETVKYDVKTIASNKAVSSFKALGTVGAEVIYAYVLNADGSLGSVIEQDALAATGKFSYTPATKTLTFNAGDLSDGMKVAFAYKFDSGTSAQTMNIDRAAIPSLVLVTAEVLVKDLCDGLLYQGQIDGLAQVDPNWAWDLGADKEPAMENLKLDFVVGCGSSNLYSIIIFNENDAT
jgi:hypothetical protein